MMTAGDPYDAPQNTTAQATESAGRSIRPLVTGCGLFFGLALVLAALAAVPLFSRGNGAARRTYCKNNLKQIGLALHNYHDMYESFPPAFTVDEQGQPLHSWRVLILPFIDQQALYDAIDLGRPWNHPANKHALAQCPDAYRCPSSQHPEDHTSYLALVGDHRFLKPTEGRTIKDITDGSGNTLAVIEVTSAQAVPWMAPDDADAEFNWLPPDKSDSHHTGGQQALLADGSVRFVSRNIDAEALTALQTTDAGDLIGDF